jgi:hypothetical protein
VNRLANEGIHQLDLMKVWVKKQENDKQVSRTVSERHVERIVEHENIRQEQLLTMHSNSKHRNLLSKFHGMLGLVSHIHWHQIFIPFDTC